MTFELVRPTLEYLPGYVDALKRGWHADTDVDNFASRKVIEANGGVLVEEFTKTAHHGGTQGLRYRIPVR
jgi:hypothetical protein